jgi:ketopantoate hydroxymethyltransferase
MITAYDFPSAKQAQDANIDMILVGDSLGMTVLGTWKVICCNHRNFRFVLFHFN